MANVRLHAKDAFQIRQLLAVIDLLEEQQGHDISLNEHRYAGIEKEGKDGRKSYLITPLDKADLVAHFQKTGAAKTDVKQGELHLYYAAETDPYTNLIKSFQLDKKENQHQPS